VIFEGEEFKQQRRDDFGVPNRCWRNSFVIPVTLVLRVLASLLFASFSLRDENKRFPSPLYIL
jgi:hypothetical protein